MRITLASYRYRPGHSGGGTAHTEAFIREAHAAGHALSGWPELQHPAVRVFRKNIVTTLFQLRRTDVLYVRLQERLPKEIYARWFEPFMKRLAGSPLVVWEFNTVPEQGLCIGQGPEEIAGHRASLARLAPHCDLAVCVSEKISAYVGAELGIRRSVVIPNGAYLAERADDANQDSETLDVVWAGSAYIRWNAFDLLVDAARLLARESTPIRFHLVGPGTELLSNLPANIRLYGSLSHVAAKELFRRMHVGLCFYAPGPADYGSSLKFFDYCSSGLPVITTPHPQMDDLQREAGTEALVVADRNPATLAAILRSLCRDPKQRLQYSQMARDLIATKYNWPMLTRRLFGILEQTLAERRR